MKIINQGRICVVDLKVLAGNMCINILSPKKCTDFALVLLLLTLNMFCIFFWCVYSYFEQVNACWVDNDDDANVTKYKLIFKLYFNYILIMDISILLFIYTFCFSCGNLDWSFCLSLLKYCLSLNVNMFMKIIH